MDNKITQQMKTKLGFLSLCAHAVLLCSCAATSFKKTWKAPNFQRPVGKIAVVAITERGRGLLRQGFENRFVTQLTKAGSSAVATFDQLSLPDIKNDKRAAADRFRANGAKALLIVRLAGTSSSYNEVQLGGSASTFGSYDQVGWYDYYSGGFMSPTYGSLKENVDIETSLFDMETEKRIWFGITRTVLKENMDRVEEMDPLVEKIVAAMRKDGVIP
jgi:hypothetical protein